MSGALPPDKPTEASAWAGPGDRINALGRYFVEHADRYTPDALRQAASEAGFSPDEIDEAYGRAATRQRDDQASRPIRRRARWIVLAAYGLVYAAFAVAFMTVAYRSGAGIIAIMILTVVLGVALLVSVVWVNARRPSAEHLQGALWTMLLVPFVLLVGVAGVCLAGTQPGSFGMF